MVWASAVAALCAAAPARAEEGLRYFEDDALSFEHARAPAKARPEEVQPAQVPAPPPPAPEKQDAVRPTIVTRPSGGAVVLSTDPRPAPAKAKPTLPGVRPQPQDPPKGISTRATADAAAGGVNLIGGDVQVEILRVRPLNKDERKGTMGRLRCADPMTAEIRPDAATKAMLARSQGISPDRLPAQFGWIFGRDRPCEDRPEGPLKQKLDALEAALRRAAPPRGKP
jgi:hypothetical protein